MPRKSRKNKKYSIEIINPSSPMLENDIAILHDMEKNNYLMTRAINTLNSEINQLGRKGVIRAPKNMKNDLSFMDYDEGIGLFTAATAFCGAIWGVINTIRNFQGIINVFFRSIISAIGCAILGGIIGVVIGVIVAIVLTAKKKSRLQAYYEIEYEDYENRIAKNNARIKNELKTKEKLLTQRKIRADRLSSSQTVLAGYYDKIGIDSRYRNIVAIGYMEQFIKLGISNKLNGTDGLYYLIMQELHWDQLNHTLAEISSKFDTIIHQNNRLYSQFIELNEKCSDLIDLTKQSLEKSDKTNTLLENIEENTEIAAYNTQRAAAELAYTNYLYLTHSND